MRQVERQRAREGLTVILSVTLARDRTQSGARERAGDPALGASAPPPAHPARAQTRSAAKRKQSVDRSKHTKQRAPDREKNGVGETEENLRIRLSGIGTSSEYSEGSGEMEKEGKTKKETHTFVFATRRVRCIPRSPMPIGSSHTQSPVTSGHVSAHISRMIDPTQRDSRARQRQSRFPGASHDSALTKSDALRPNSLCTFMTRLWRRFTGLEALRAPRRCRPPRAAIRRVERQ